MSAELELVGLLERFTEATERLYEVLERGSARGGVDRFERVEWAAGEFADFDRGGNVNGWLVVNLSNADAFLGFAPGTGDRASASELTLPARSWVALPTRQSFVSVGGDSAGEALIAPLFTPPEPAMGNFGEPEVQEAIIDTAAAGDTTIVAAVPGRRIALAQYVITAVGAVVARWRTADTAKTGPLHFGANGGIVAVSSSRRPLLRTNAGEPLDLNLSGAVQVGGHAGYWLE